MKGWFKENKGIVLVLIAALVLRVFIAPFGTLDLDFNSYVGWSNSMVEKGPSQFYEGWSDYLPGYLYVLWGLGFLKSLLPAFDQGALLHVLYKLPAIFADVLAGLLVYLAVSRFNKKFALPAACLYLFNPAVIVNSTFWGQIDGMVGFFVLAALFFADLPGISSLSLAFGALVKVLVGFVSPLVGLIWLKRLGWKKAVCYTLFTAFVFLAGFIPFSGGKSFFGFVFERLGATAGQYPYTSVNAFNFWALGGMWKPDAGLPKLAGITALLAVICLSMWFWWKYEKSNHEKAFAARFLVGALILAGTFLFMTRMHERHLLPAFAPLAVASVAFPLGWISYAIFSVTYLANLRFSYVWITQDFKWAFPHWVVYVIVVLNLASFGIMCWSFFRPHFSSLSFKGLYARFKYWLFGAKLGESGFVDKYWKVILAVILLFALGTRLYGLYNPPEFYFDEVYHSYTAREMAKFNPDAWVWYGKHEEGRAFSWDHPPIAKVLMAWSISILGENPFAWRLPGALLGVAVIVFIYLIGMQLFRNRALSLLASALFALDGLPLVLSRIGTNDSVLLFFAVGTIYFFLKDRHLLGALFFGLAIATKWSAIWIPPVVIALMIIHKKRPGTWWCWYIIIPPIVYLLSYTGFFTTGHTVDEFIELQKQMYWYHSNLDATHPFSSPWWTWPLMLKPVWFYTFQKDGLIYNINAHGNPLIFWLGLAAVFVALFYAVFSLKKEVWSLLVCYFGLFLPWSLSPRIMFIYHYLPSVPFLCLILSWALMGNRHWKKFVVAFLILALVMFIFLYPRWVAIPVTEAFNSWYDWLPG